MNLFSRGIRQLLSCSNISKRYGANTILSQVNIEAKEGEFLVLVGPSGCGKSSLLRIIAGLDACDSGCVRLGGRDITRVDPSDRGVAMVFQSYALYPHLTVYENMEFALKMSGVSREERRNRVYETAEALKLTSLLERLPKALSGGQRQRVAIGRAIVRRPKLFLFDEPLSNLDAALRVQMRLELARLHRDLGITIVYVTHDQVEAMTLGDRIVVMKSGEVIQVGRPLDIYKAPVNRFVAEFIGTPQINIIPLARAHRAREFFSPGLIPESLILTDAQLGWRPDDLELSDSASIGVAFEAVVEYSEHLGDSIIHYLTVAGVDGQVSVRSGAQGTRFAPGTHVFVKPLVDPLVFDSEGVRIG